MPRRTKQQKLEDEERSFIDRCMWTYGRETIRRPADSVAVYKGVCRDVLKHETFFTDEYLLERANHFYKGLGD